MQACLQNKTKQKNMIYIELVNESIESRAIYGRNIIIIIIIIIIFLLFCCSIFDFHSVRSASSSAQTNRVLLATVML
jgi:hypothetical protein